MSIDQARFRVSSLYPIALLEGEGMGTAYEYSAKLKLLGAFVAAIQSPQRMIIGGLPEAYGLGLDLALLAGIYGWPVVVADDRAPELDAFAAALRSPQLAPWVDPQRFEMRHLPTLAQPTQASDVPFDLWVTTSAIQRLKGGGLEAYLAQVRAKSRHAALMVPNKDNPAHLTLTRMDGFALPELVALCQRAGLTVRQAGHVDLPPFPPGISRSSEAKERAAERPIERLAMGGLEWWARGERLLPRSIKRRFAHIAYAWLSS